MVDLFSPIESFQEGMRSGPPWDSIVEFVSHPSFCGMRLYPRQMTLLKLIYLETEQMTDYDREVIEGWRNSFKDSTNPQGVQPDIWDRVEYLKSAGYDHFPLVQMVLGRRASKGILGGILTAERIAWLYSLGNWQRHFNQVPGQVAEILVSAPSLNLAVTRQFKDIRNTVFNCAYLREHIVGDKITEFFVRTPGDEQTIIDNQLSGVESDREIATIACKASTAASTSGRGGTGLMNCLDPETPVLTADLEWVPIKRLCPGDEIIAVDEEKVEGSHRRVRRATVLSRWSSFKKAYRLTFDDGSSVVCSGDHRWLCRDGARSHNYKWRKVRERTDYHSMKPGTQIVQLVQPWEPDDSREAGYLAGIYDGEGSVSNRTGKSRGTEVFVTQNPGVVLDTTLRLLKEKGFNPMPCNSNAYLESVPKQAQQWSLRGVPQVLRFLGQIRPQRLLAKAHLAYEGAAVRAKGEVFVRTVVSVEELPEQELVDISTTTGTFIANGLISHNCYDEFAHMLTGTGSSKTGEEIYDAYQPSLDQFGKAAMTYVASSPYCLEPSTRVLTGDLRWVPVSSLKVGDKVVGFDEHATKTAPRCWRQAEVTETSVIRADRCKVITQTGKEVVCTGEHMWLAKRVQGQEWCWIKASDLRPGDQIKALGVDLREVDEKQFRDQPVSGNEKTASAEEVVTSVVPVDHGPVIALGTSTDTLVAEGMLSHNTKIGKFYELYQEGRVTMEEYNQREGRLETQSFAERAASQDIDDDDAGSSKPAEPTHLIVQLPSWELYRDWERSRQIPMLPGKKRTFTLFNNPIQYRPDPEGTPDEQVQYRRKIRNPDKFKVERGGQFATVQDAYLDEYMVDRMFARPSWREPLAAQDRGRLSIAYRAHADPSRTNANFGFCIAHLEDAPPDEYGYVWPHVIIDVLKVWKPEDFPDHTIDYVQVTEELDGYLTRFPTITKMSYDQFNSAGLISHQKRKFSNIRILEKTFTEQENQDRFEKFKTALNAGWVHSYRDDFGDEGQSLLELELKFLQEKVSGSKIKVDKQDIGPVQTKDLADAVMVVVVDLLHDSLDRWYKNLNRVAVGSTNVAGLKTGREQERQTVFSSNRENFGTPMEQYFASEAQRAERRAQRAEKNRAVLERNKLDRARRNSFGYRSPYEGTRTRGRML